VARYQYQPFEYAKPPEAGTVRRAETPVLIVGAGPIGLACAIDLALHGIKSIVVDDNDVVSVGSRAICWAKRTLEIFDRLGVGDRMVEKGITWKVGRLFHSDKEVYNFDLLPEAGHKMPAFINLQQYYVEEYLVQRSRDFAALIDLRWKNKAVAVEQQSDKAIVSIDTPDGPYRIEAQYVLACDGAKSAIRQLMGLDFEGRVFEERFLICDIEMEADFPSERWFWFEPPFHKGESALLHKQPDNIYRIDLQLGPDADPEEERKPERVIPRIKAMLGDRPFQIDWTSVYTFHCRRLARFVHDRVIFMGDSAHVVSPFGARGGNGGIQDVDNLGWKLAYVLKGWAPPALLESYNAERIHGADENIQNSARTTAFMTPRSAFERALRRSVLDLAADHAFARRMVNSGRLSTPCSYESCGYVAKDRAELPAAAAPGKPAIDTLLEKGWLLNALGNDFVLASFGGDGSSQIVPGQLRTLHIPNKVITGELRQRYLGEAPSAVYLFRPDQHVLARWASSSAADIAQAMQLALAGAGA
jgi:3-(3-hydroxy-phenyl)propionate hydroxylase